MMTRVCEQRLDRLLAGFAAPGSGGELCVTGLNLDSRALHGGELFLAVAGHHQHGARYIEQALSHGAAAIALEPEGLKELPAGVSVPLIEVHHLHQHVGEIAARFYGDPSREMEVVGVTGTNGKTSVSHFIAQALNDSASTCGLIGTLGSGLLGQMEEGSGRTTPDPVSLQAEMAQMLEEGARRVVMEVSSHGLDQGRIAGTSVDVAVFTNLSRDHLDYHGDMQSYAEAKRRLFTREGLKAAVINRDDVVGRAWLESLEGPRVIDYGMDESYGRPALFAHSIEQGLEGIAFSVSSPWGDARVQSTLLGRFNVANLLATLGALLALELPFEEALERIQRVETVAGRMERFGGERQPLVVVDYAHTPDALKSVLEALRGHCKGRLWCLFGCGGERDRGKRAEMGAIAEGLADYTIVTNDNPRSEVPRDIIAEILGGMSSEHHVYVIEERHEAIRRAVSLAREGDVVLVAGKGHERYQEIGSEKLPFSDIDEVCEQLQRRGHD